MDYNHWEGKSVTPPCNTYATSAAVHGKATYRASLPNWLYTIQRPTPCRNAPVCQETFPILGHLMLSLPAAPRINKYVPIFPEMKQVD